MNRIWTLVFLTVALLIVAPQTVAAQSNDTGATMVGLKFDVGEMKSTLADKLRQEVSDVLGQTPLKFVEFKDLSAAIDPVTQDCFTVDCLTKIGAKTKAPLGLRVEISGENEIYAWTFETWNLESGVRIDAVRKTCELCGDRELLQAFSSSLKIMLDAGPGGAPEKPFELKPGEVLVQVNVVPEEAEILFNEELIGQGHAVIAVDAGEHDIHIRMDGYRDIKEHILMNEETEGPVLFRYHLSSTSPKVVEVPPTVGPIDRMGRDMQVTLGLVGVGLGVVSVGTGIYLSAIDGDPACDAGVLAAACPDVYATGGGGVFMGVLGATLLTGGATLLSWELLAGTPEQDSASDVDAEDADAEGAPEAEQVGSGPSLSVSPALGAEGGGLVFSGSF